MWAGFFVSGPIGGGFDFGDNFVGRYQAYQSSINGIAFSPSLAYRIGNKLSVGGGVSALNTLFNEKIAVNQGSAGDGRVKGVKANGATPFRPARCGSAMEK